ncbi:hypothetical protein V2J09_013542 [Rumex salicifolius]
MVLFPAISFNLGFLVQFFTLTQKEFQHLKELKRSPVLSPDLKKVKGDATNEASRRGIRNTRLWKEHWKVWKFLFFTLSLASELGICENLARTMGKTPVKMKAVIYALSPYQQKVMPGLWKDLPEKISHKISDNWLNATLLISPLVGVYSYVQYYQEKEKHEHRY